jgi:2-dehydro-3-deoxygluconokinase
MKKVLCFGELLLRLSPAAGGEWLRKNSMPVYLGGAELNVAHALAKWNIPVAYFTSIPDHYLSREILQELSSKGIDISRVLLSGNRIGTYYIAQGSDLKNAGVIYDRAGSSFAELNPGTIDWQKLLEGIDWFHFSAICPALSNNAAIICKEVLQAAKTKGITVSVDLNYRSKLWQYGKEPMEIMPELVEYCSVLMGNLWSVEKMLGIESSLEDSIGKSSEELVEASGKTMLRIHQSFPAITDMAFTFRLDKSYFGVMQHGKEMVISKEFVLKQVLDKAGSGDCFMAGLIYGLTKNNPAQQVIDFASAAAVGKLSEIGDATQRTEEQVLALIGDAQT